MKILYAHAIGSWICLLLLCVQVAEAQVKEDSMRNVYGAHSVRILSPSACLNFDSLRSIDTLLHSYDLLSVPQRSNLNYVDLGNLGSATRPLLYERPRQIGARTGLSVYNPYFVRPEEGPLYHTYAPFVSAQVLFGGDRRNVLDVSFSRNFSPTWNLGFDFSRFSIEDQVGPKVRGKLQTLINSFRFHTHFATKDSAHVFYTVFSRMNHESFDYGGSVFPLDALPGLRFASRSAITALSQAKTTTLDYGLESLYRLRVIDRTYLYLKARTGREKFIFYDDLQSGDSTFYTKRLINQDTTNEFLSFREQEAEVGLIWKGNKHLYRVWGGKRWLSYEENLTPRLDQPDENYLAASLRQAIAYRIVLLSEAKRLGSGHYSLAAGLEREKQRLMFWIMRYKPAFMEQAYVGNHHNWRNHLRAPQAIGLALHLHKPIQKQNHIGLRLRLDGLRNYIYYNKAQNPVQLNASQLLGLEHLTLKGRLAFLRSLFVLEGSLHYRQFIGNKSKAFAFPSYQAHPSLYYQDSWFEKTTRIAIGLRWRWRSSYHGFAYQPALQQFYIQDEFLLHRYGVINLFFKAKIRTFRLLLRITHANKQSGGSYFATPYYLGEPRLFDLKFTWQFYN